MNVAHINGKRAVGKERGREGGKEGERENSQFCEVDPLGTITTPPPLGALSPLSTAIEKVSRNGSFKYL